MSDDKITVRAESVAIAGVTLVGIVNALANPRR